MMKVEIYTETSIRSPRKQSGHFGYILVYRPEGKDDATMSDFEKCSDVTPHEIELQAMICAMKRLNRPCEVCFIQSERYIQNMVTSGNLAKWKENGWMSAKGEEVKNKDLWQQLAELMERHTVTWSEDTGYQQWLIREVQKRKEKKS